MRGVQPGSGVRPFKADKRTFSHYRVFGSISPAQLPKTLGRAPLKIVDQFQSQFCTGAGTSTASEYQERRPLSFEFQVAAVSRTYGKPILEGADPYSAMKARVVFGCLPDELTPDSLRLKPDLSNAAYIADWRNWPQELWDKAKEHCAAAYFRVDGPLDHFDNARIALHQGQAEGQAIIAFGLWEAEWNNVQANGIVPSVASRLVGLHCYDLIDFCEIGSTQYIIAQNSYGSRFGKGGLQLFDRATFNRVWSNLGQNLELFIYRDVSPETIEAQKRSLLAIYLDLAIKVAKAKLEALLKAVFAPKQHVAPQPAPKPVPAPEPPSAGQILHQAALSFLGKDASPLDAAPDELGCVDSFLRVYERAFGVTLAATLSTAILRKALDGSSRFVRVDLKDVRAGDVILCATGEGKASMPHGHVGVVGEEGTIMSNDSRTGTWRQNYTVLTWTKRYGIEGGYPIHCYRPIASA